MQAPGHSHTAELFDGWSAVAVPVRLELDVHELRIVDADGKLCRRWAWSGLHCDGMQDGDLLNVTHVSAPHESLAVRSPELAARLRQRSGTVQVLPGGSHKLRFALGLLATLAVSAGLLYHFIPTLTRALAARVPLEQERALGGQLDPLMSSMGCSDPAAEAALRSLSMRLSGAGTRPFVVRILRADVPNAFALPGGTIVVTDALLHTADSPGQVAGVLAHEIEHVVQRHVLAGFLRGALLSALWSVTMGDYSGLLVVDPSTAYRLKNLSFSREDETAADSGAIARLHRAGLRHAELIGFFERLRTPELAPAWLSTHPSTQSRIARLQATPDVTETQPALDEAGFQALHNACRSSASAAEQRR